MFLALATHSPVSPLGSPPPALLCMFQTSPVIHKDIYIIIPSNLLFSLNQIIILCALSCNLVSYRISWKTLQAVIIILLHSVVTKNIWSK